MVFHTAYIECYEDIGY